MSQDHRRKHNAEYLSSYQRRQAWTPEVGVKVVEACGRDAPRHKAVPHQQPVNGRLTSADRLENTITNHLQEDEILKLQVARLGTHSWPDVANGLVGRTSKACSLRWRCFLSPNIIRPNEEPLSQWEVAVIVLTQRLYGNKWNDIARYLPMRCNNDIKNHFNLYLKDKQHQVVADNSYLRAGYDLPTLLASEPENIVQRREKLEKELAAVNDCNQVPPKPASKGIASLIRSKPRLRQYPYFSPLQRTATAAKPTANCLADHSIGLNQSYQQFASYQQQSMAPVPSMGLPAPLLYSTAIMQCQSVLPAPTLSGMTVKQGQQLGPAALPTSGALATFSSSGGGSSGWPRLMHMYCSAANASSNCYAELPPNSSDVSSQTGNWQGCSPSACAGQGVSQLQAGNAVDLSINVNTSTFAMQSQQPVPDSNITLGPEHGLLFDKLPSLPESADDDDMILPAADADGTSLRGIFCSDDGGAPMPLQREAPALQQQFSSSNSQQHQNNEDHALGGSLTSEQLLAHSSPSNLSTGQLGAAGASNPPSDDVKAGMAISLANMACSDIFVRSQPALLPAQDTATTATYTPAGCSVLPQMPTGAWKPVVVKQEQQQTLSMQQQGYKTPFGHPDHQQQTYHSLRNQPATYAAGQQQQVPQQQQQIPAQWQEAMYGTFPGMAEYNSSSSSPCHQQHLTKLSSTVQSSSDGLAAFAVAAVARCCALTDAQGSWGSSPSSTGQQQDTGCQQQQMQQAGDLHHAELGLMSAASDDIREELGPLADLLDPDTLYAQQASAVGHCDGSDSGHQSDGSPGAVDAAGEHELVLNSDDIDFDSMHGGQPVAAGLLQDLPGLKMSNSDIHMLHAVIVNW